MKIKAVVIDDEPSNRSLVSDLIVKLHEGYEVCGDASGIKSGYKLICRLSPDVVFLDVKMLDGSGFDLLKMFDEVNFETVFVTGFDEYAIRAFEFNALDYVLKPVDLGKFKSTLIKVKSKIDRSLLNPQSLKTVLGTYNPEEAVIARIPVHHNQQVIFIDVNEVMYIMSMQGCTVFKLSNGARYTSSKQLSEFEFIFEKFEFLIKVSRNTYINLKFVTSYTKGADCVVTMKDNLNIEIARRKKSEMLEILSRSVF